MSNELKDMMIYFDIAEHRIIWEMHQKRYMTSVFIIITQVILIIIQAFVHYMFKDIKINYNNLSLGSILGFVIAIFNWILLAILMFNLHINSKAWREAVEKSDKLFRGEEK